MCKILFSFCKFVTKKSCLEFCKFAVFEKRTMPFENFVPGSEFHFGNSFFSVY